MSKKPAAISINLIPKDPFFDSTVGRILQWALSAGRYIVIFTELVVIVSFAARFTLDREITDLNSDIHSYAQIIEQDEVFEQEFVSIQDRLTDLKSIDTESDIIGIFQDLTRVTPQDIDIQQLAISPTKVTITGRTLSQTSFNLLVNNLQLSGDFFNINITRVESGDTNEPGFGFNINADTKVVTKKGSSKKSEEKVNILDRTTIQ
jgi:Tfp pilus assembly protein PilN